jgi:hypothetical protein
VVPSTKISLRVSASARALSASAWPADWYHALARAMPGEISADL